MIVMSRKQHEISWSEALTRRQGQEHRTEAKHVSIDTKMF